MPSLIGIAGTSPAMTEACAMSPELSFALILIVKMAITAAFVVAATVTAERAGPLVGGLVATLPIGAGPAYVFLALDHDASFIAQSAVASLAINAVNAVFACDLYAAGAEALAARQPRARPMSSGSCWRWRCTRCSWSIGAALLLNVVALASACGWCGRCGMCRCCA